MAHVGPITDSSRRAVAARGDLRAARESLPGFSLLELLLVLALATLLLGLLMPSIARLRESARQIKCANNLHQFAVALSLYGGHFSDDALPGTVFARGREPMPQEMMMAHIGLGRPNAWDGVGWLYNNGFLGNPEVYYCPSHRGQHPFERYSERWRSPGSGEVFINFHYRGLLPERGPIELTPLSLFPNLRQHRVIIMTDGLRTRSDYSHVIGSNVLGLDMSVQWFPDDSRSIFELLPEESDGASAARTSEAWRRLDKKFGS